MPARKLEKFPHSVRNFRADFGRACTDCRNIHTYWRRMSRNLYAAHRPHVICPRNFSCASAHRSIHDHAPYPRRSVHACATNRKRHDRNVRRGFHYEWKVDGICRGYTSPSSNVLTFRQILLRHDFLFLFATIYTYFRLPIRSMRKISRWKISPGHLLSTYTLLDEIKKSRQTSRELFSKTYFKA